MQKISKDNMRAYLDFLKAKYDAYSGSVKVRSVPYYAMVDTCDICQLRCPTCPAGIQNEGRRSKSPSDTKYRIDRTRLSPELFDALIEELGEYLFLIDFHSWGRAAAERAYAGFYPKGQGIRYRN